MTTTPIPTGPPGPVGAAGPNKLLIALIAVGGVLLLAIVAHRVPAHRPEQRRTGQRSTPATRRRPRSPADPATPVAEPTDEAADDTGDSNDGDDSGQAPVDNSLRFTSFNANHAGRLRPDRRGRREGATPDLVVRANATKVYWTPNNQDATADNGYQVGSTGNQNTMSDSKGPGERYEFPCNHRQTFDTTITIYGANGQKVSKHVTFTDINWNTGGDDDED